MSRDEAVKAAADALADHYASGYFCRCGAEVNSVADHMAAAAVDAAWPVIERAVRDQVDASIRALVDEFDDENYPDHGFVPLWRVRELVKK